MKNLILSEYGMTEKKGIPVASSKHVAGKFETSLKEIEEAILRSYRHPDELDKNLELLHLAEDALPNKFDFPMLRYSCCDAIMRNHLCCRLSEKDVCSWFRKNIKSVLGTDYKLLIRENDPKHVPDFWVENNNESIPVEIKLHSFDPRHLKQLQRYMTFYDCKKGIAIANKLNCALPENIEFYAYDSEGVKADD